MHRQRQVVLCPRCVFKPSIKCSCACYTRIIWIFIRTS
ncbi:MAG: DUF2719 domain-containing protein [Proteobacteria bacterium]|nr:DUF2719 domain-containing protein [Pseudomonadota bacterium]